MTRAWIRRSFQVTGALASLALFAGAAWSQNAVFSGKVTSSGQPLGGASVGLPEIGVGAITDMQGKYSFTVDVARARGRTLNLTARFIGFKPKVMPVTIAVGRTDKDFDLEKDVLNLEQVVVTGVSDATSQKNTAFSVGVVDASQMKEAPATSPLGSLEGKVAGASIVTMSGQPGSEPAIRLRAATSLTGRQDPLIIVDGTITRLGMADINSEDIERVEVIKGAAASSLYGSDAANGVVQIFTKRGANLAEGQTTFTLRNEMGDSYLPRKVPNNLSNDYIVDPATHAFVLDANGNRQEKPDKISNNPYPVTYDQFDQVFKPGQFMTNYVSVGQRRGSTNFNASFQNTHESGVLALLTGFSRQNFRVNLDQSLSDNLDFSTGAFYGRSTSDQGEDHGIFFGLRFLEPNINLLGPNADGSPYNAAIKQPPLSNNVVNPMYGLYTRSIYNDRDRFTGTFKMRYRPFNWLTAEGNVNYDESNQAYKNLTPLGFMNSSGAPSKGSLQETQTNDRSNNIGATLTATKAWSWVTNTTKLAWIFEDQTNNYLSVNATALSVPKVPEFAAALQDPAFPVQPGSSTQIIRNQNTFAVTTFDFKDRYILDGLVRRDESSLFGSQNRGATYQRLSFAWRLSQDFHIKGVDEFKLRASYGTAGLRPQFDAQYEVFQVVGGSPQKVTLGNPLLKPAYSREQEFGFNMNFLRDFTLDYSYSNKVTSDQIMLVPVSAGTGYQNEWMNAATLAGQTHEVALGAVLVSKADFFWRLNISGDHTKQTITQLSVGAFNVGPDANTALFHIAANQSFGVMFGQKWIRTLSQLQETIASKNLGGTAADYVVNEEGFYVAKSAWRTVNEVPLKYYTAAGVSVMPIGDVNPDFNLSANTNLQYKAFSLNAVVTVVKGGQIYNMTRQWGGFSENRDVVYDQRGKPANEQKPVTYYGTFYAGINPNDYFVEDGSYIRLRELSLNWSLPKAFVKGLKLGGIESARLGIVGRNLWTKTNYSGYDPDVSGPGGGNPFAYRVDYFTYPAYRTFTAMLELGY
jgi:TonB-linked SusC/RagA family outer membrane protein